MLKIEWGIPWKNAQNWTWNALANPQGCYNTFIISLQSFIYESQLCIIYLVTVLAFLNIFVIEIKVAFLNKGSLCPLCSNEAKPNAHLFFSCRKSLQVWAHIRDLVPFRRRFTSLQRITDSLIRGRSTSGVQGKLRCLAITITVYCIWLSRNKLIFEDYQFCFSKIKVLMYRQAHMLYLF